MDAATLADARDADRRAVADRRFLYGRRVRWPVKIDKATRARWQRQKRTGDSLPKRAQRIRETQLPLLTEAKGLGKA